jgi:hypothetical protein
MTVGMTLLLIVGVVALGGLIWMLDVWCRSRSSSSSRAAAERAEALLRQILGAEDYGQLVQRGYLDVPSPAIADRIYRIPYQPGWIKVIEQQEIIARLCVVPNSYIPAADVVLLHKLLIEGDESRYLRVANHFPTYPTRPNSVLRQLNGR